MKIAKAILAVVSLALGPILLILKRGIGDYNTD